MPSNETDLRRILREFIVCPDGLDWAKERTIDEAFHDCQRADWLLYLGGLMAGRPGWPGVDEIVALSADCARTALRFIPRHVDAPRKVLGVAREFVHGVSSVEDLAAAADRCYRVGYSYWWNNGETPAAWACFACFAVGRTAYDATWAYEAATAAADAHAEAVGESINNNAMGPVKLRLLRDMADLIRNRLGNFHGLSTSTSRTGLPLATPRTNRIPRVPAQ
jgi:hypothetical protein